MLRALKRDANMAIIKVESGLPAEAKSLKWQAAKHSPAPWSLVHAHYINTPCDDALLLDLLVIAQLAEVVERLQDCIVKIEAEGKPLNLKLAKVSRQTIQIEPHGPKRLPPLAYEELP